MLGLQDITTVIVGFQDIKEQMRNFLQSRRAPFGH